jgi:hypothetical protein
METFLAPVSRPGADTRPEGWQYRTEDGLWQMDRNEGERLSKWDLTFVPWKITVDACRTLRSCQETIARGGGIVREGTPPWGAETEGIVAWAFRWKGTSNVQRCQGEDLDEVRAWAEAPADSVAA